MMNLFFIVFEVVKIVIDDKVIEHIEKALGFKLYNEQKMYLQTDGLFVWHGGRGSGHTTAHCIKLALSDGEPLDMRKPERFADHGNGTLDYARYFYKRIFMDIWYTLNEYGFPVRQIFK